jgi:N-acetylglucosaminyl-diphospho-decaprenol L-rhamnosyltransferase
MRGPLDLSIVIVSFNARADLDRCLTSLRDAPPSRAHEIIVVDNASSDGSAEAARQHANVRVIQAGANAGFAAGNNLGIRASTGTNLLLLNSDTIVPAGAIDGLLEELDRHDDVAAVGPRIVDGSGRAELSFGRMVGPLAQLQQLRIAKGDVDAFTRRERYPDWVTGACLLVRRADAEAAGLLDERYFMYMEDVDFCAAIRARGRRVLFAPRIQITHLRGRSSVSRSAASGLYHRNLLVFYRKHHPFWAPWLWLYLKARRADI